MDTITEKEPLLQAKIPEHLLHRLRVLASRLKLYPRDVVVAALEQYLPGAEKEADAADRKRRG